MGFTVLWLAIKRLLNNKRIVFVDQVLDICGSMISNLVTHKRIQRNTSTEGHVFEAPELFVDGIWQLVPKQPNHRTNRVVSKSGEYLIEW